MFVPYSRLRVVFQAVVLLAFLLTAANGFSARSDDSPPLFTPHIAQGDVQALNDRLIVRSRLIDINFDLLAAAADVPPGSKVSEGTTLQLDLFGNESYTAVLDRWESTAPNSYSWSGHLKDVMRSQVAFAVVDGVAAGTIQMPGALFRIKYVGNGTHSLNEIDLNAMPPEKPPIPVVTAGNESAQLPDGVLADDGSTIDVLVVYDAAARAAAGGTTAMNALINLAVTETNTGYSNSGVTQRVRLVHAEEVTYDETGFNWNTTLTRLAGTSDGYMDNVHTLRDTYGADEVVLLVNDTAYCGLGYQMTTVSNSFKTYAFALVSRDCATGYYSFAHEMGHNMGANHDRANASGQGAYSYSYGYQAPNRAFRTVMAYDCDGGCPRINWWSNPDVSYQGQATGVVYTASNSADNHRTLNNTASTVANFRTSVSTCSLTKPTLISPSGSTSATPTYTWNSVAGAEQYALYVSDSGTAGKINTWYTAAQVNCSSGGTCSITPATALATGAATFWVRGWASCNGGTYGSWSDAMNFTVATSTCSTPAKPTLVSPTGTITTTTPAYTWNAVSGAEQYELYVTDSGKAGRIDTWYTAAQVNCSSGGTCSITPATALATGAATFWVRGWASCNGGTYGSWSDAKNFTVATSTCSTPAKPTLVSPTGTITTTTPTYTWNAVSGAEWYWLYVSDSAATGKISTWYTASQAGCASGTGNCSITPSTALAAGNATFWVQAYKSCGGGTYGSWSDAMNFTVATSTCSTPAKPTLVSPTGTVTTTTPTYTWNALSGAEWYNLYVSDSSTNGKISTWYTAAQVGCSSGTGTCSITPTTSLATGTASFWVLAYKSCGGGTYGPWSDPLQFTVSAAGGGLNEQFSGSSATNWIQDSGTWTVSGGYYYTAGSALNSAISTYNASFSNFDYQARVYRSGCSTCANRLFIRGAGSIVNGKPASSYYFQYTTDGSYSVFKNVAGEGSALQSWTTSSAINTGSAWNLLRIVASGSSLAFYINGTLVWSGSDSTHSSGRVGVGMYRDATSTNDGFWVDYATLTTSSSDITDAVKPEQQRFNHIANAVGGGDPDKSR